MKRIFCLFVFSAFLLSGCGTEIEVDSSANTGIEDFTHFESTYDSYIVYACDNISDKKEIDDIARIIESRAIESTSTENYGISQFKYNVFVDYDSKEIYLNFDYVENWTENFIKVSALPNSVEFRKGNLHTDEIIINNKNIINAHNINDEFSGDWAVIVEFDENGSTVFADVTREIAGTETPISLWVNDELIYAPLVHNAITDGRTVITGNFSQKSSEELAEQLNFEYMPYSVSVKDFKLADKNNFFC